MKKHSLRQTTLTGMCIALGVVLPVLLHAVPDAGNMLLPMHIPVLLSGFLCGWPFALACGILTPLLSSVFTGMPPAAILPGMLFELAAYGVVSSLLFRCIPKSRKLLRLYIPLIAAMLAGRIISGLLNALVFSAGHYSFGVFISGSFIIALPGIIIQLLLIPALVTILEKANVPQGLQI